MKKFYFIIILLIVVNSLWAYQGKWGIGVNGDLNSTYLSATEESTHNMNWKYFLTFMLFNKLEIAPYFSLEYFEEMTGETFTDGYQYMGFGSMINWHFIRTQLITLAIGLDIGFSFGSLSEDVYGENTYNRISWFIPLIFDFNLTKHICIRIRQDIWQFARPTWTDPDTGEYYNEMHLETYNVLEPQFGLIISF